MASSKNGICDFGWKAKDFALKGVDGKTYIDFDATQRMNDWRSADRGSCSILPLQVTG